MIWGVGKPGICRTGQWAGDLGRSGCCSLQAEFFLLQETSTFAPKTLDEAHPHFGW